MYFVGRLSSPLAYQWQWHWHFLLGTCYQLAMLFQNLVLSMLIAIQQNLLIDFAMLIWTMHCLMHSGGGFVLSFSHIPMTEDLLEKVWLVQFFILIRIKIKLHILLYMSCFLFVKFQIFRAFGSIAFIKKMPQWICRCTGEIQFLAGVPLRRYYMSNN